MLSWKVNYLESQRRNSDKILYIIVEFLQIHLQFSLRNISSDPIVLHGELSFYISSYFFTAFVFLDVIL